MVWVQDWGIKTHLQTEELRLKFTPIIFMWRFWLISAEFQTKPPSHLIKPSVRPPHNDSSLKKVCFRKKNSRSGKTWPETRIESFWGNRRTQLGSAEKRSETQNRPFYKFGRPGRVQSWTVTTKTLDHPKSHVPSPYLGSRRWNWKFQEKIVKNVKDVFTIFSWYRTY